MSPRPPADTSARPYEVAIVGNDAVLAALPARPMQLAHAILACGYDLVVPVSWGEEVVAEHALRTISARGGAPAVFCACPTLRARLLASGSELAPFLISLVAPSVATARYLRALQPGVPLRITLIGGCPGAPDPSIDTRVAPRDFLHLLANRGIALDRQPAVFDSVVPPDRRRHFSLPGGCPAPRALESRAPDRRLVTITDDAFSSELAEHLLGHENVLIDLSPRLGCACCGGVGDHGHWGPTGREEILRHEPPRSPTPILDHDVVVSVVADVPTESTPLDAERQPSAWRELRRPAPPPSESPARGWSRQEARRSEPAGPEPRRRERDRAVVGEAPREPTGRLRLPGAVPIESARSRGARRHIAVTPSGAMSAVSAEAKGSGYWEPARTPALKSPAREGSAGSSATAPLSSRHHAGVVREPQRGDRPAVSAPGVDDSAARGAVPGPMPDAVPIRPALPAPGPTRLVPAAPVIPIPLVVESGGRPSDATVPIGLTGGAAAPVTTAPPSPPAATDKVAAAVAPPAARPAVPRRKPVPYNFQLSRAASHPRAVAGGGKVLPRAYIARRQTPTSMGAVTSDGVATSAEIERSLPTAMEAVLAPELPASELPAAELATPGLRAIDGVEAADVAEGGVLGNVNAGHDLAPVTPAVEETVTAVAVEPGPAPSSRLTIEPPTADVSPSVQREAEVVASEPAPSAPAGADADVMELATSSPGVVAVARDVVAHERGVPMMARGDEINVDVLARVRQQARRPGRVVSREVAPPREPREPGRLLVAVTTVILALALVVALAVIFRRAPTAPW